MSSYFIPEVIEPLRYAEQQLELHGFININEMPRLSSSITNGDKVAVDLKFGIDKQKIINIQGHIETTVTLQCQRCLESFKYDVRSDFILGVVNDINAANALPQKYEPAMAEAGVLPLRDLIEDEIILNLPLIPKHESEECGVKLPVSDDSAREDDHSNPFQVLASLKQKQK